MAFVEKNVKYKDLMKLSKSHLALLVLDHRKSIIRLRESRKERHCPAPQNVICSPKQNERRVMDKSKTWLEIKMDKFKDNPEYLKEYISTLEDEIAFYKERYNARFAEGFRKGQEKERNGRAKKING